MPLLNWVGPRGYPPGRCTSAGGSQKRPNGLPGLQLLLRVHPSECSAGPISRGAWRNCVTSSAIVYDVFRLLGCWNHSATRSLSGLPLAARRAADAAWCSLAARLRLCRYSSRTWMSPVVLVVVVHCLDGSRAMRLPCIYRVAIRHRTKQNQVLRCDAGAVRLSHSRRP